MNVRVALRLGRVSNLPTVTSNVLAGLALAGAFPESGVCALVCLAMSLMYVAGMYLNDAFDRDIDRVERPERPIPSGEVAARTVFDAGFAMLAAGIAIVAGLAVSTHAGWRPVMSVVALGALIIFYNADHKQNRLAPVVMGLCRVAVYTTAAFVVRAELGGAVAIGCALLLAYLVGLTFAAKQENLSELPNMWPLAFLGLPFFVAWPRDAASLAIYAGFLVWVVRCVLLIRARRMRPAVTGLIAGISLLDALLVANAGRPDVAAVAIAAFVLTTLLQRVVPGT